MKNVIITLLSLTVSLTTLPACNNVENKEKKNMTTHQHTDTESIYACPMHPEVTGKPGEKCPICKMDLKAVKPENAKAYQVLLSTSPQNIEAGKPVELKMVVQQNGKIVNLDISHEIKMHLMVVSEDLTWFRHLHPRAWHSCILDQIRSDVHKN